MLHNSVKQTPTYVQKWNLATHVERKALTALSPDWHTNISGMHACICKGNAYAWMLRVRRNVPSSGRVSLSNFLLWLKNTRTSKTMWSFMFCLRCKSSKQMSFPTPIYLIPNMKATLTFCKKTRCCHLFWFLLWHVFRSGDPNCSALLHLGSHCIMFDCRNQSTVCHFVIFMKSCWCWSISNQRHCRSFFHLKVSLY